MIESGVMTLDQVQQLRDNLVVDLEPDDNPLRRENTENFGRWAIV